MNLEGSAIGDAGRTVELPAEDLDLTEAKAVQPEETVAIVVGIEAYDGLDTIDGVARDARKFARWLVEECRVPRDQVLLFISEEPACTGGDAQPATQPELFRAFHVTLRALAERKKCRMLIIYWSGHGFLDRNHDRRLDCKESRMGQRFSIHFELLRYSLLAAPYPPIQVAFIDACAGYILDADPKAEILEQNFLAVSLDPDFEQFVFYAQRPGLLIENRAGDKRSFRNQLYEKLEEDRTLHSGRWPPDIPGVTDRIQKYYQNLRRQKRGESTYPVFHRIGWDGNVAVDPEFYARPGDDRARSRKRTSLEDVTRLDEALRVVAFFEDRSHRRAFAGSLPESLARGLGPDDPDRFYKRLAQNILGAPADLGRLLESFDYYAGLGDEPLLSRSVLMLLDRLDRRAVPWTMIAWLRRLVALAAPDDDPGPAREGLELWVGRQLLGGGPIAENLNRSPWANSMGYGSFLVHLAGFLRDAPEKPPLVLMAEDLADRLGGSRGEALRQWAADASTSLAGGDDFRAASQRWGNPKLCATAMFRTGVEGSAALISWSGAAATAKTPRVRPTPTGLAAGSVPAPISVRMVVTVQPLDYRSGVYGVRCWLARGQEDPGHAVTPSRDELTPAEIAALIRERLRHEPGSREVEMFLPDELLAQGLGGWSPAGDPGPAMAPRPRPVDAQFPVKLRSWYRYESHDDDSEASRRFLSAWQARWAKLSGSSKELSGGDLVRLADGADYDAMRRGEHDDAPPVCLAASLPPPGSPGGATAREVVHQLLLSGAPIALWPAAGSGAGLPVEELERLVTERRPDELPGIVHGLRQVAWPGSNPLHHICLLWDDPTRLPPLDDEPLISLGYG